MRLSLSGRKLSKTLSLTQQVALLSLLPIVALGLILAHVLAGQIVTRSVADASRSAQLIARIGIQPRLTPYELSHGLDARGVAELDRQLRARSVKADLARIKIWNNKHQVIYSDDHRLIGRTLPPSDELRSALAGHPQNAGVVNPKPHSETADEVGLGRLVEVYVPLRFTSLGPPAGVFEIYLSYRPIAAAIARDKTTIALLVSIGLALLWAVLFRIVARAARRLRRQSEENYQLAYYDQLTGLPNRRLFIDGLAEAIRGDGDGRCTGVLLIDLDGFKEINNTLGSRAGDRVLREVAGRIRTAMGAQALIARLGGDEYGALCARAEGLTAALGAAAAVQSSLEAPILLDDVAVNVEASIGAAVASGADQRVDQLLRRADAALARAKAHGSRIEVFSPDRDAFDPSRLLLLAQVRPALERDEFILHYQPQLDLQSGRITGVEALLRWRHPERGLLAPLTFIPLVEQTALIGPLTLHVVAQALRQMVAWRKLGLDVATSVNLSARNLLDPDLTGQIAGLLRTHGVEPARLTVEVTESAAMANPERAAEVLHGLRGVGVGVSIDDFGTGNASIAYLTRLPASELKIDRSFITGICKDQRAPAIVRSTIELARHLELRVIAEGVESASDLEHVTDLGCDSAQGYLISRPLTADELTAWLAGRSDAGRARPRASSSRRVAAAPARSRS